MDYPANQEIGKSARKHRSTRIDYCLGRVYEAMGQAQYAEEVFRNAADSSEREGSEADYFRGRAMLKRGEGTKLKSFFRKWRNKDSDYWKTAGRPSNYFAKFGEQKAERVGLAQAHYMVGLARLGQSRTAEAEESFTKALELDPAHLEALTCMHF